MSTMTFNDFMLECELYPYSNEYFELMKESSELELMEKYLENQKFVRNNSKIINSGNFMEGYFSESIDTGNITALTEAAAEKAKGLLSKIGNMIKKLLGPIINFFKKIWAKIRGTDQRTKKIADFFKSITINDAVTTVLSKAIPGEISDDAIIYGRMSVSEQSADAIKKLNLKFGNDVGDDDRKLTERALVVILASGDVNIHPAPNAGNIVSLDSIRAACDNLLNATNAVQMNSATDMLNKSIEKYRNDPIIINIKSDNMQNITTSLANLRDKVGIKFEQMENEDSGSKMVGELRSFYNKLNTVTGTTMKFYNDFVVFRERGLTGIEQRIKEIENAAKADSTQTATMNDNGTVSDSDDDDDLASSV